jgi:hypothetical protein
MNDAPATLMPETLINRADFSITAVGIIFHAEPSEELWEIIGQQLGSASRSLGFAIGDWINHAEDRRWGSIYERAIQLTKLEYKTLRNFSYVARSVQLSLRKDNLSFEVHAKVASLPEDQQHRWLKTAAVHAEQKKPISSRRLAKSILIGRVATEQDMQPEPEDRGRDNVHPHVNRIVAFWRGLKASGWLDSASGEQLQTLLRDLQPVLQIADELRDTLADMVDVDAR